MTLKDKTLKAFETLASTFQHQDNSQVDPGHLKMALVTLLFTERGF